MSKEMTDTEQLYREGKIKNGIQEIQIISSWKNFHEYVTQSMMDSTAHVWRGQRCAWPLSPSFDRHCSDDLPGTILSRLHSHLDKFQETTRGRRGPNPPKIEETDENTWWALGQHNNLDTPLLDWTHSPFVALFFAFVSEDKADNNTEISGRVVYAINRAYTNILNDAIMDAGEPSAGNNILSFFSPQQDENARLISQNGLFSRSPVGVPIDIWLRHNAYEHKMHDKPILTKIFIPNEDRHGCLRALNRMNINYLTLFPDLEGASKHANMTNLIPNY